MNRFFVIYGLVCVLLGQQVCADEPPKKLADEKRKELESKWYELDDAGQKAYEAEKYPDARKLWEEALDIARRLYPKAEFPDGHADLAKSLNNVAVLDHKQRKYAEAEPLLRDALDMYRRLFKGDHRNVANTLNNLATLFQDQGKYADAETLYRDALDMRRRLFKDDHLYVAASLNDLAILYYKQGKYTEAEPLLRDALDMRRRLFKGDHPDVAASLNILGLLYLNQEKYADSEPFFRDALDMQRRLFKGDHPDISTILNNLATLYHKQGKFTNAEASYRDALEMTQRLFKDDHPLVALCLNNLALLYKDQAKYADAEPLLLKALEIRKRLYKSDHPELAFTLNNLGILYMAQGKYADAEPLFRDALDMNKRRFNGDNQSVATSMNNLAHLYQLQGNYADAEPLYEDVLKMYKRLKSDHPNRIRSLVNLAHLYDARGKYTDADALNREALVMSRRLIQSFATRKSEGEALTFIASLPLMRDDFISTVRHAQSNPDTVYPELWASKGLVTRVYEQRRQAARAATADPAAAKLLLDQADARRRRAGLLLAPEIRDPTTRQKREEELKELESKIAKLDDTLRALLPAMARSEKLNDALPSDLQKVLPVDVAVLDFIRYIDFTFDKEKPGKAGEKRTLRYLVFVMTCDKLAWVDLDTAEQIEDAITTWREIITSGKGIPTDLPAKVRELLWEKVRKELPASIKTLYISPDAALCKVPFGAIPGDKPGTVLLEDFAIATVPHTPFLLDKSWPQDPIKKSPQSALVVGGVKYDAEAANKPSNTYATRGTPLLVPEAKLGWSYLPGSSAEIKGVETLASRKKLVVTRLEGEGATSPAVLAALPNSKYAHFATHGFFADASFRSVFQLDPKDYEKSQRGERIGRAANSPLIMTGLVFAGANSLKTPDRGIITGESLIDLDLSGLELAVLSACETGLGDVAGGEGTFGLQRAFHMAGTRNVVASLWKVPDQSTAALMALFYHNLWDKNFSPMESLRQAQLEIYRNPGKIKELAQGFRGQFTEVSGKGGEVESKPSKDGKSHPLLWAAFTLSGPGR